MVETMTKCEMYSMFFMFIGLIILIAICVLVLSPNKRIDNGMMKANRFMSELDEQAILNGDKRRHSADVKFED